MKPNVVVGAGVVGLLTAYEIRRRGGEVLVIDKAEPGAGCSLANTGWVVPSFSSPVPGPGMVASTLRGLLRADSAVSVKPSAVPAIGRWLMQFWRHCNEDDHAAGRAVIANLNRHTAALFDAIEADGVQFEMHRTGLLSAFTDQAAYDRMRADLDAIAEVIGLQYRELKGASLMAKEPCLTPDLLGAIFVETDRHVRPETLIAGLVDWLTRAGVEVRSGVEMTGVVRDGFTVAAVETSVGQIEVETVLLATGVWSGSLAWDLGFQLPMQAAKGYTITVKSPEVRLNGPVYLPEKKIVTSPYKNALRIGGTIELSGVNDEIDRRRLAVIRKGAEAFLPGCFEGGEQSEWVGMRPLAPDGLPVIGRAPNFDNLYLATGHGMLGITLGPATAAAAADLVLAGHTGIPVAAFDPARFATPVP